MYQDAEMNWGGMGWMGSRAGDQWEWASGCREAGLRDKQTA